MSPSFSKAEITELGVLAVRELTASVRFLHAVDNVLDRQDRDSVGAKVAETFSQRAIQQLCTAQTALAESVMAVTAFFSKSGNARKKNPKPGNFTVEGLEKLNSFFRLMDTVSLEEVGAGSIFFANAHEAAHKLAFSIIADWEDHCFNREHPYPIQGARIFGKHHHDYWDVDATLVESRIRLESARASEAVPTDLGRRVSKKIDWNELSPEQFERLVFNLFLSVEGYEGPRWLTNTCAADGGRDIEVDHVTHDPLRNVVRTRIVVQCRHRVSKSVGVRDLGTIREQIRSYGDPPDVLVIATSGRFSKEVLAWIDSENRRGDLPKIEPWPNTHLEVLVARFPEVLQEIVDGHAASSAACGKS